MVVSPRHRASTRVRADREPVEGEQRSAFGLTVTRSFARRIVTPVGATPTIALPESLSIVHESETDSPRIALF